MTELSLRIVRKRVVADAPSERFPDEAVRYAALALTAHAWARLETTGRGLRAVLEPRPGVEPAELARLFAEGLEEELVRGPAGEHRRVPLPPIESPSVKVLGSRRRS